MPGFDKLNKSDLPDWSKDEGSLGQLHRLLHNKSKHFAEGTTIMMNNKRGTILHRMLDSNPPVGILVEWENGSVGFLIPQALNRS